MQAVMVLRRLWRLRVAVVVVGLLSVSVGIVAAYRVSFPPALETRKYELGIATARLLVDTPDSQVVEVSPKGSDTLGVRASLLASLMVEGVIKNVIAQRAGLRPAQLEGISESSSETTPVTDPENPRGYELTTRVLSTSDGALPIIEVQGQAPDGARAARLADAAVTGLRDYLDSKAVVEGVASGNRLQVTGLGRAQARDVVRGPRLAMAIAAAVFLFAAGCTILLLLSSLAHDWNATAGDEDARWDVPAEEGRPEDDSDDGQPSRVGEDGLDDDWGRDSDVEVVAWGPVPDARSGARERLGREPG
jgi:hypothetical protein